MRSLFSPNKTRSSRLTDSSRDNNNDDGNNTKQRRSFAFMKYGGDDRRTSASMKASREHARRIALTLSMQHSDAGDEQHQPMNAHADASFQPDFPPSSSNDSFSSNASAFDFNPFGHDGNNNPLRTPAASSRPTATSSSKRRSKPMAAAPPPLPPQEDFFAAAAQEDFFASAPPPAPPPRQQQVQQQFQRKSSTNSSHSGSGFGSFDTESASGSSAFDLEPMQQLSHPSQPLTPAQRRMQQRGRPPRNAVKGSSSEASFGSFTTTSTPQSQAPSQHSMPPPQPQQPKQTMSTFPSNSSMQSSFTAASPPAPSITRTPKRASAPQIMVSHTPPPTLQQTPPPSASGAAARRRQRSQMRHSSNSSLAGSSVMSGTSGSFDGGTPPASPHHTIGHRQVVSGGSIGASSQHQQRNRVTQYTISGQQQQSSQPAAAAVGSWQHSPSPSMRGMSGGASVCSSVAESDVDLFDRQNNTGGFTFDAFGLDASEIDREVQEAMAAIGGEGSSVGAGTNISASSSNSQQFNPFGFGGNNNPPALSNNMNAPKPQDTSGDDFEPQAWDSPPGSRRSTPVPPSQQEEEDGFVDGFRVSKPSPLPQISVHRSPASSERSSSLSSITDHNMDHGAPRRNVFKEKAGFMSSSSTSNHHQRPPPQNAAKKEWVPPPGAVKMLTPPRHGVNQRQQFRQRQQQQQHHQQNLQQQQQQPTSSGDEAENFWNDHLSQIDNMLKVDSNDHQQQPNPNQRPPQQQASQAPNDWQPPTSKYSPTDPNSRKQFQPGMPQPAKQFQKRQQEEKKDDESEERDNHTDTTSAMTTVVSEPPSSSLAEKANQVSKLGRLDTNLAEGNEGQRHEATLSPQELRKKELDELRKGGGMPTSSSFKSQAAMLLSNANSPHHSNALKPQQQRANECNDQRTSFASLRERLKSPVAEQQKAANNGISSRQQQQSTFFATQGSPQAAKSEVGVSSFTRRKMEIASLSSSSSKSEVGYGRSPRNQHQPEVTSAVMNRMREMNQNSSSGISPAAAASPSASPAFMAVKLRKTETPPPLQPHKIGGVGGADSIDSHEQRKLTYRERREMELREMQEQEQAPRTSPTYAARPMSQAQKMAMQQESDSAQEQKVAQSPSRMSYRERRELELAKERELQQQQEEAMKSSGEPKRDVADLIRRRVAENKTKGVISPSSEGSQPSPMRRDGLRPNSFSEQLQSEPDQSHESDRFDGVSRQQSYEYDQANESAQHSILPPRKTGDPSEHAQLSKKPSGFANAGGLSSLHAQLKGMKHFQPTEEEEPGRKEEECAPRRLQAMVGGRPNLDQLEVNAANSQSSDHHGSPSRTPKATYAMLNAFLHGRETVCAPDETPVKSKQEEQEDSISNMPGSPKFSMGASASVGNGPALKEDPKYARYFTMLKIGMPMDVVKHAMIRDNLDPNIMDGDHNKPACVGGVALKDDPKYAKYFKMLKIGMPMEAVKHSMERDGLDSHVMDQDHNMPADITKGKQDDGPKEKDSHRRSRLHWKPIREVRRNSLWAKIDQDLDLDNIDIDEEEFAELFQAEIQPDGQQAKKGKKIKSPRKGAAVRVIDPKRANNGGIILARLKMSHDEMADIVERIDENGMTGEQIEHIIEYLPTSDERKALETYMLEGGQDAAEKFDGLCECEKFMVSMMTVKHAKRKVRALLFKLQFESCLEALYQETHTVEASCDELSNSVRLRQLLGIVLTFGNRLNTAGKGTKKKAGAFTLDSLLKLNQAKAFDKKTTFLNYIVQIVQRNNELLLRFRDDLPTIFKADKVFWDQCVNDLEEVENQLENVRRIALYQARQAKKFRRQKKKKHHEEGDDDESLSDMSLSLEEEVEALRSSPIGLFTLSAIKKVSFLRDRVEGTKVKFQKLLEYFGEDEKNTQPHELFSTMVKFCRDFDKAKEQVFADEKKKKREERKRQSITANNQSTPASRTPGRPPQHNQGMVKLSSMQPNASRLIDDMKRNSPAFSSQQAPSHGAQRTPERPPAQPVSQYQQPPVPRRASAPVVSPRYSADSANAPPPEGALRGSATEPVQRPTRAANSPVGGQSFGFDLKEMQQKAAKLTQSKPQEQLIPPNPVGQRPSPPSHGPRPGAQLEESIPRAMQERRPTEHQNGSHVPTDAHPSPQPLAAQEMDSSMSSTETGSAALRRKARMRSRRHTTGMSPPEHRAEDPPASSSHGAPPMMDRQYSEPALTQPVAPPTNFGASQTNGASNANSALLRNKLRQKRLLDRQQKVQHNHQL